MIPLIGSFKENKVVIKINEKQQTEVPKNNASLGRILIIVIILYTVCPMLVKSGRNDVISFPKE